MNPYFYPDLGGDASAENMVLIIMDGVGVGQEEGCQYIQDLGHNGCDATDDPLCPKDPNGIAQAYFKKQNFLHRS